MFLYFTRILNKREFTEEKTGVFYCRMSGNKVSDLRNCLH